MKIDTKTAKRIAFKIISMIDESRDKIRKKIIEKLFVKKKWVFFGGPKFNNYKEAEEYARKYSIEWEESFILSATQYQRMLDVINICNFSTESDVDLPYATVAELLSYKAIFDK